MSDELTCRLRELAESAEVPPLVSGAGVRAVAVRRRHRRRTTAFLAGGCAAATLAAVVTVQVTGGDTGHRAERRSSALASPRPVGTPTPAPSEPARHVTVDLSRRVLTLAGRELPISAGTAKTPTPTGVMTVTGKDAVKLVTAEAVGFSDPYRVRLRWVLELTPVDAAGTDAPETSRAGTYIAAVDSEEKAPGNHDTTPGWIALGRTDAAWLYEQLAAGTVVDIRDPSLTPTPTKAP